MDVVVVAARCGGIGLVAATFADDRLGPEVGAAPGRLAAEEALEEGVRGLLESVAACEVADGAMEGLDLTTGLSPARAVVVSGAFAP